MPVDGIQLRLADDGTPSHLGPQSLNGRLYTPSIRAIVSLVSLMV